MITHISSDQRQTSTCIAVYRPLTVFLLLLPMIVTTACTPTTTPCRPLGTATCTWAQANYDYANTRDAVDSSISSQNVNKLGVAWIFTVAGVSIYGALATSPIVVNGTVYLQDLQDNVYTIDLQNGALKWEKLYNVPIVGPNGVAVDQGKVFVESSPETVTALDAVTGTQLWPRQIPRPDIQGIDQQLTAYHGTGTTYWGIGNAAPYPGTRQYPNGSSRPGPNLYTNSELALTSTGQLQWYQQIKPHGLFDDDFEASPILTTATVKGVQKQVVIGAGKLGYVLAFDAHTGQPLWKTSVGMHQNDETQNIPAGQTITVLPGESGGVETPMALADGVVYVPIVNAAAQFSATSIVGQALLKGTGELDAIDVNTGKILWASPLKAPDFGGATVAGDLVFTSTFTGQVLAFNRSSGHQVWSWQSPRDINSPLTVVGDMVLPPAGLGTPPMLVALKVGATGSI